MARPHRKIKGFRSRIEPASLASLWQSHGKATEARDLLTPAYGWFTEGLDSAELTQTKSLLDELSCTQRWQGRGGASGAGVRRE